MIELADGHLVDADYHAHGGLEYTGPVGRITEFPRQLESRFGASGSQLRWKATGLAIPVGIALPDGRGGFDVIESRAAFIASEDRPVWVYDTHDRERLLGWATLVWHGNGWHARGSVAAPPSPASWSPMFRSLQSRDMDGMHYHQQAELIELSLAEPRNAIWGERTRATIALEMRDRWGHRPHAAEPYSYRR